MAFPCEYCQISFLSSRILLDHSAREDQDKKKPPKGPGQWYSAILKPGLSKYENIVDIIKRPLAKKLYGMRFHPSEKAITIDSKFSSQGHLKTSK